MRTELMAEQLFNYENPNQRGSKPKYPWDEWFAKGTTWKLTKGEDFDCSVRSMHVQIRRRAGEEGLSVSVHKHGNEALVLVNKDEPTKNTTKSRRSK